MAQREAKAGDELAEMACRCGKAFVRRHQAAAWRCRDCGSSGSLQRLVILGEPGTEPRPLPPEVAS